MAAQSVVGMQSLPLLMISKWIVSLERLVLSRRVVISWGCRGEAHHHVWEMHSAKMGFQPGYPRNIQLGHMVRFLICFEGAHLAQTSPSSENHHKLNISEAKRSGCAHAYLPNLVSCFYFSCIGSWGQWCFDNICVFPAKAWGTISSLLHRVRFASVHGRPEALRKAYGNPGTHPLQSPATHGKLPLIIW